MDLHKILEDLYKAKANLEDQLAKVNKLLSTYEETFGVAAEIAGYPKEAAWKDKILYALKHIGEPTTPSAVAEYLYSEENDSGKPDEILRKKLNNTTAQYMPKMAEDRLIQREKPDGKPYVYFIK